LVTGGEDGDQKKGDAVSHAASPIFLPDRFSSPTTLPQAGRLISPVNQCENVANLMPDFQLTDKRLSSNARQSYNSLLFVGQAAKANSKV